jgi:succinoglycan biosynthesis protein ExoM
MPMPMSSPIPHISVCICTYKRPEMLARLLDKLQDQETGHLFSYSIVVVDNDAEASAKGIVEAFAQRSQVAVQYDVEPEKGFAQVRNRAVGISNGDFIAFIDDDEFPDAQWLLRLYMTLKAYSADGVLGPILPHFEFEPPNWIVRGGFCERETFPTGTVMRNHVYTRTGNVLLNRALFDGTAAPFDVKFGRSGGEDSDFFKRMMEKGKTFIWCNDAPVWETVPPERTDRLYVLKRALKRGLANSRISTLASVDTIKSMAAVILYTAALPVCLVAGQHIFMKCLMRNCDHIGKLLGFIGMMPNDRSPQ